MASRMRSDFLDSLKADVLLPDVSGSYEILKEKGVLLEHGSGESFFMCTHMICNCFNCNYESRNCYDYSGMVWSCYTLG